jgi:mRNA interferase HigB
MIIVGRARIADFSRQYSDAASSLEAWLKEAETDDWKHFMQVKERYPTASPVEGHTIFNIRGNRYRLDVVIIYESRTVIAKRFGRHSEYNRWTFE